MKYFITIAAIIFSIFYLSNSKENKMQESQYNKLTPEEERVILRKGTEPAFTGKYNDNKTSGVYLCKRCDEPLFISEQKFNSGCGWPSFDDEIQGAVERTPDPDGIRTEITCVNCGAHLGHVFKGEGFTDKNLRHCVNSISLNFVPDSTGRFESAYFAGGCFWGVEYFLQKQDGVIFERVGYMGGDVSEPSYEEVCSGTTGHAEAVEVIYDTEKTNFEELAKLFFEIHDPTQANGQGPDIGEQYRSAIFYTDDKQKRTAEKLIKILEEKGLKVATELSEASKFWEAEKYHQDYYRKTGKRPYCHFYKKKFKSR